MTETELWKTVIKCAEKALETTDGTRPSRYDVNVVAARTMMLFLPECELSQVTAARSTASYFLFALSASLLAIASAVLAWGYAF